MYDVCNTNGVNEQNCVYDGPGFVLHNETAEEILLRRCPDFFSDINTPVCCTAKQVLTMESSIQMAEGIFGRCQSCLQNMMKSICGLACDPEQDKYMNVTEIRFSNIFNANYAFSVDYRIDTEYTTSTYESCKEVVHPSSGRQAMELACGAVASKCNPEKWFHFMGDPPTNTLVPFKINYVHSDNDADRFTADTKRCYEAYEGAYACSCVDCEESCPIADPPLPDDPGYLIFDLNGTTFIIAISIGSLGVVALIFGSVLIKSSMLRDLPRFLGGFEHADEWISKFFRWWGRSELNSFFFQ